MPEAEFFFFLSVLSSLAVVDKTTFPAVECAIVEYRDELNQHSSGGFWTDGDALDFLFLRSFTIPSFPEHAWACHAPGPH